MKIGCGADWADEKVREIGRRLNNSHPVRDYEAAYARALRQERAEATARVAKRCAEIADERWSGESAIEAAIASRDIADLIRAEKWGEE